MIYTFANGLTVGALKEILDQHPNGSEVLVSVPRESVLRRRVEGVHVGQVLHEKVVVTISGV